MAHEPSLCDAIRASVCKVLLAMSKEVKNKNDLARLSPPLPKVLPDLINQVKEKEASGVAGRDHEVLRKCVQEILQVLHQCSTAQKGDISDMSIHAASDPTDRRIEKAGIVESTPIEYSNKELLQVVHGYLTQNCLHKAASALQAEAGIQGNWTGTSLDKIVKVFLKQQHQNCANPISTLPPLSLKSTHCCPTPSTTSSSFNFATRLFNRSIVARCNLSNRRFDVGAIYSRFRLAKTLRDEDSHFLSTAFLRDGESMLFGCADGCLTQYNLNTLEKSWSHEMSSSNDTGISGIRVSRDNESVICWFHDELQVCPLDNPGHTMVSIPEAYAGVFGNFNEHYILATSSREEDYCRLYDALSQTEVQTFRSQQARKTHNDNNIASFHPEDNLILSDGILWDVRCGSRPIHWFDKLFEGSAGCFHPGGNEIIIDKEVWDVRKRGLLFSCPALHNSYIHFSPLNDIMYAVRHAVDDREEEEEQTNHWFKVVDSSTYQHIHTQPTDRAIVNFAVHPQDRYVALMHHSDDIMESVCKVYTIGRVKRSVETADGESASTEEDEEDEEDEELEDDSDESEDESSESGRVTTGVGTTVVAEVRVGTVAASLLSSSSEEEDSDDESDEESDEDSDGEAAAVFELDPGAGVGG
uniref:LisH domain-containing protein n=1 Tax=Eutreptiella gymnastica TaxID=73025 RepID=A0A7S1IRT6_9EUGL